MFFKRHAGPPKLLITYVAYFLIDVTVTICTNNNARYAY